MRVSACQAEKVTVSLLVAAGSPANHSAIQAETLVGAERRGHPSHGLQHVASKGDIFIIIDPSNPSEQMRPTADHRSTLRAGSAADPDRPVTIPGDGSGRRRKAALAEGFGVNDAPWSALMNRSPQNLSRPLPLQECQP